MLMYRTVSGNRIFLLSYLSQDRNVSCRFQNSDGYLTQRSSAELTSFNSLSMIQGCRSIELNKYLLHVYFYSGSVL